MRPQNKALQIKAPLHGVLPEMTRTMDYRTISSTAM